MLLKVCGLKYKENIEQVAALKPDFMGFIFYPQSKRFVGEDFKMPVISNEIKKVGVFVNATEDYIIEKCGKYNLDYVQLHGDESADFCENLTLTICKGEGSKEVKVIKAFGVDDSFDFNVINKYKNSCSYFLFDTKTTEYGGSGKTFDWSVFKGYDNEILFFLSGGIGVEEIDKLKIIQDRFPLFAIDVNSKFEMEPGLKDVEKLKQLKINVK
jgi:phosphoribosylanthranilate isomerase